MNKRITFAGNILVDNVKMISTWPEKGMLVPITSVKRAVGGSVCNSGIDLKVLDPSIEVRALGKVGHDDAGAFALDFLSNKGLDVSRVMRVDAPTTFTDVMTVESTGERTFFNMHGADSLLVPEDVDAAALDCDIFHLGYLLLLDGLDAPDSEFGTQAARLLAHVRAQGIRTSVDIVSEQSERFSRIVRPALAQCDYCIINEVEGGRATGLSPEDAQGHVTPESLRPICEALFKLGVKERVVIHCPMLGCSLDAKGNFAAVPSLRLPASYIKGSVGAGDAFCAGMLYSFLNEMSADEGLRLAAATAAANLAVSDSVSGALSLSETYALAAKFSEV